MGDKKGYPDNTPLPIEDENGSIQQVLDKLPPEERTLVERSMVSCISMVGRSSPESEVAKQITSEHITQMLSNQRAAMNLSHKDETNKMILFGGIVVVVLIAVLGVIFLLKDTPETMEKIVPVLITAIISGLGGYGIGKGKSKDDD